MYSQRRLRNLPLMLSALFMSGVAFATTPIVTVTQPANNSKTTGPVNYVASASSPNCASGISAMRIYSAPGVDADTVSGGNLNTYINLLPGTYNTVVQAWDNCGGAGTANVTITITGESKPAGFVYTVNSNYFEGNTANFVQGFSIVPGNGALAKILQGPVNANVAPMSVASDKAGHSLYVGDYVSGDVFAYSINRSNGYLTPVTGSPFPVGRSVTAVAVHPNGKLIFATRDEQAAGDGVEVFQRQSDGSLKPAPGSPYATQIGPQALIVDPSGKYLYVADFSDRSGTSDYIDAFEINGTSGTLTPVPGSPFPIPVPGNCTAGAADATDVIDLAGKYLYTADAWMDSISGFAIGGAGTLTDISGSPWPDYGGCNFPPSCSWCSSNPSSLAIDGTGKFFYGINSNIWDISIYSIGANGMLSYLKDTPTLVACFGPVRTDSSGNYLYAGSCNAPYNYVGLVGYSINHQTGDLTELPTSPYTFPEKAILQSFAVTK